MIRTVEFFAEKSEKCTYRALEFVKVLNLKRKKAVKIIHRGTKQDIVRFENFSMKNGLGLRKNFTAFMTTLCS